MESEATNPSLDLNEERAGAPIGKDPKRTGRDDKVSRMGTASIPRLIVEFAIPSILGMLVNGAYNVIDSVFLGQAMGEIGLATATVAMPIMTVFMAIAMLVGNGGNALAALRMGEGNRVEAERSLGIFPPASMRCSACRAPRRRIGSTLARSSRSSRWASCSSASAWA